MRITTEKFAAEKEERLDALLQRVCNVSRRQARAAIDAGSVTVNGHSLKAGEIVHKGARVEVSKDSFNSSPGMDLKTDAPVLEVLYEDEYFLAINKPQGMSSVRLRPRENTTLADLIVAQTPQAATASRDIRDGGLVHRLDYYSSGAILAAKNREIWEKLFNSLCAGEIIKTYQVIVDGEFKKENLKISYPLYKKNNTQMGASVDKEFSSSRKFLEAETNVKKLEIFTKEGKVFSKLEVSGHAMRRHQIRVHLSSIGHPLTGDALYGGSSADLPGYFLHCSKIEFIHPVSNTPLTIITI